MTITTYTDREIKLQKELALEKQLAQLNGEIAAELKADKIRLEEERDEYQQAADKMAMAHKVERDTLHRKVAELEKELNDTDIALEECKMDWSGDVTQIKAEHKHEVGNLCQQLEEAQALIEASRKQEPVSYMSADGRVSKYASVKDMPDCMKASFNIPLYTAPVVADDVPSVNCDACVYRYKYADQKPCNTCIHSGNFVSNFEPRIT